MKPGSSSLRAARGRRCRTSPERLFSTCATPITSPLAVMIGAHAMLLVVYPVCSSMSRLNRGSAYASSMINGSCVVKTRPAMPASLRKRISRSRSPCTTREYSSPVASSLRNSVPRSASVSSTVMSTSAASTSSSVSIADTVRETCRSVSASWRRFPCSELAAGATSADIRSLQTRPQRHDHLEQLLALGAERALARGQHVGRVVVRSFERAAERRHRRLQLLHLVGRVAREQPAPRCCVRPVRPRAPPAARRRLPGPAGDRAPVAQPPAAVRRGVVCHPLRARTATRRSSRAAASRPVRGRGRRWSPLTPSASPHEHSPRADMLLAGRPLRNPGGRATLDLGPGVDDAEPGKPVAYAIRTGSSRMAPSTGLSIVSAP